MFLYIIFFPQLVSGPITRAAQFMPQIVPKRIGDVAFVEAAKWILVGYFFKLYVANNLNEMTSYMDFPLYETLRTQDRWLLVFLYSYQIYADFFGYSAIALGLGLLFGYRLPVNFNLPYISTSFSEFWTRWHISLSNWLRTYLYIPLGGNRHGPARTYLNLMIVMTLGGLWHGASLSYALWGMAHGFLLVIERPFLKLLGDGSPAVRLIRMGIVFFCVTMLWIFFKLPNFDHALSYLKGMFMATDHPNPPKLFTNLALLYALPVIIQHAGIGALSKAGCGDGSRISMARSQRSPVSRRGPTALSSTSSSEHDSRIVDLSWLVKCAVAAAAVLLAGGFATARSARPCSSRRSRPGTAASSRLNRYVQDPTPDVVLVGSSVAWRLKEEYFCASARPQPGVRRRLAVDGPRIVANQQNLPKIVLIETNVLSRAPRQRAGRALRGAHTEAFRPVPAPGADGVAAYERWNHAPPDPARVRAGADRSAETAAARIRQPRLSRSRGGADERGRSDGRHRAQRRPHQAAHRRDQRRGTPRASDHVPFAPEIEGTRMVRMTNENVNEAFPDRALWLPIDPPQSELRWGDGVHLDERSALIVVRAIESARPLWIARRP